MTDTLFEIPDTARLYELGGRAYYDLWLENSGSREVRLMAIERRFSHAHRPGR